MKSPILWTAVLGLGFGALIGYGAHDIRAPHTVSNAQAAELIGSTTTNFSIERQVEMVTIGNNLFKKRIRFCFQPDAPDTLESVESESLTQIQDREKNRVCDSTVLGALSGYLKTYAADPHNPPFPLPSDGQ